MICESITIVTLNAIAASGGALSPRERWAAARQFDSVMTQRWFIIAGIASIVVLTVLLAAVTLNRRRKERKSSHKMFDGYCRRRGLSKSERDILRQIAAKAGLKRSESVFTLSSAFDRGAGMMLREQMNIGDPDEVKEMRMELSFLREKLGFKNRPSYSAGAAVTDVSQLNSRQIPVGKEVQMTRRKARDGEISATITHNTDSELGVRLSQRVKITFGEYWCVRYYFGSSVWEFDTSVVSYDGDVLVLEHSDNVRFINRRRFLRLSVKLRAYVAYFPFKAQIKTPEAAQNHKNAKHKQEEPDVTAAWGPPEFIPAVITEIAGPGLRVRSSLKAKPGDKVLLVFNLNEEVIPDPASSAPKQAPIPNIVQAMGEVRHSRAIENGWSIAVELASLNDRDIGELIKATNHVAVKAKARAAEAEQSYGRKQPAMIGEGGEDYV